MSNNLPAGAASNDSSNSADGQPSGLLHVEVDYPIDQLEELHDWYNTEHIPERLSIPGILTGQRYAAIEGSPRWLALYDLASPAVLDAEAYLRYKGPDETVWTRRILLPSRPGFRRTVYELLWSEPGEAGDDLAPVGPPGLFSLRLTGTANGADPAAAGNNPELRALLTAPGVGRGRFYRDLDTPTEHLFMAELSGIWAVQSPEFRTAWSRLVTRLTDESVAYARAVQVLIL